MNQMLQKSKILRKQWVNYSAIYSDEELTINVFQVMQSWENGYMKKLAEVATSKGGHILEVGFGLGISAGYIQKSFKIKSHTVIECHPDVISFALNHFKDRITRGKMSIINGFWEDIAPKLKDASFDGILFDSSPLHKETVFFHFFPFFKEAYRLLKKEGILTYFSDEPRKISPQHLKKLRQAGFSRIDYKICKVNPSRNCRYWPYKTIIVPVILK